MNKVLIGVIFGLILNGVCFAQNEAETRSKSYNNTAFYLPVEAETEAKICNNTTTSFHFRKTNAYQANTSDNHSADFILDPESCTNIHFWVLTKYNEFDNDDALDFKDINGTGMFTIKGSHKRYGMAEIYIVLGQVLMNDFYITEITQGYWGVDAKPKYLELSIYNK